MALKSQVVVQLEISQQEKEDIRIIKQTEIKPKAKVNKFLDDICQSSED